MPQEQFPGLNPDGIKASVASLWGSAVFGVYYVVTRLLSGQPVTVRDCLYVLANVAAATFCGLVTAYFIGPTIASLMLLKPLQNVEGVGFVIGALLWEVMPFIIAGARARAKKLGREQGK